MIPDFFIDRHLAGASGEFVKVYLFIQRHLKTSADLNIRVIADSLYMTEADVRRALAYWQTEGVLQYNEPVSSSTYGAAALDPAYHHPAMHSPVPQISVPAGSNPPQTVPVKETLAPVVVANRMEEEGLSHLAFMADTYLGKPLSQTELNTLFYFYDKLHFPVDLIEYLLEYCVSNNKKSMRYIETVAISWYEQGIDTIEKAKEAMVIYNKNYYAVMKAFGISNRNPGPAEATFIKKWLEEYCFDLAIILEACNRTLAAISQPSFPYADSILARWKKSQVHTLDDVKALDNQFISSKKNSPRPVKEQQTSSAPNRFHNFEQREYNYQDLEQQFIRQVNGLPPASEE
jgi:DnaD/phage-associated family protein